MKRFLAVTLLVSLGCGDTPPATPAPVRGTVTFQGQPLAGGLVVFTPDRDAGRPYAARLDNGGRYELEPAPPVAPGLPPGVSQGVPPGRYRVTLSAAPQSQARDFPRDLRHPVASTLERDVLPDQENVLDFHVSAVGSW